MVIINNIHKNCKLKKSNIIFICITILAIQFQIFFLQLLIVIIIFPKKIIIFNNLNNSWYRIITVFKKTSKHEHDI